MFPDRVIVLINSQEDCDVMYQTYPETIFRHTFKYMYVDQYECEKQVAFNVEYPGCGSTKRIAGWCWNEWYNEDIPRMTVDELLRELGILSAEETEISTFGLV